MLIPSIDLINGHAVQLVGGKVEQLKIDAGDPVPIARQFRIAGELAVVDLDAALSKGNNNSCIEDIIKECAVSNCIVRVGGGIRDVQSAINWLNKGVHKVVLGTAATPEILSQLPKDRVIAAVDALNGEVVVKGWTTKTGANVFDKVKELKPYVAGFLVTFVEREGKMQGIDMKSVKLLKEVVGDECELTIAGGVTTLDEIAELDKMGVKAQVGMALYTGHMNLADGIIASLTSDRPDGLFPTVVVDEQGVNLGLVYSDKESVRESVKRQKGVYHSRKRGLWIKGETSGATQDLLGIRLDCDRDALCFIVHQNGKGFCHLNNRRCWEEGDFGIPALVRTLEERKHFPIEGSYTNRLLQNTSLLHSKILEEARELTEAKSKSEVIWEAADVIYFTLVACVQNGVSYNDLQEELNKRSLKVTRRGGDSKPPKKDENSNTAQITTKQEVTTATPIAVTEEFTNMKRLSIEEAAKFTAQVQPIDLNVLSAAKKIVDDVRERGEKAVIEYGIKLGDIKQDESVIMNVSQLKDAFFSLKQEEQELLRRVSTRIRKFAESQKNCLTDLFMRIEGGNAGHKVLPLESAGCYAPGGRYPLPSSVLMTVITARVAGVKNVWVASPRPTTITMAAAYISGANGLLKVGGAHAIAALAFGLKAYDIPPADAVVGPGNKWVTAAKQLISGRVKIDMLAGPSECLVIADQSANASVIAADLLAQAEHDIDARPLLICVGDSNQSIAESVDQELHKQLKTLPTADTAKVALARNGVVVLTHSIEEVVTVSDSLASEHLELHLNESNMDLIRKKIKNYGGLFVGENSAEVFGDYGAGPNHVLPTGGTSRYTGGLSVFTFMKIQTFLETSPQESTIEEFNNIVKDTVQLAHLEGLYGHANAASLRLVKDQKEQSSVTVTDKVIKKYLRTDIERIDKYKPVKPLEILAEEIGIPASHLIKIDANENLHGAISPVFQSIANANLHIYPDPSQTHLRREIAAFLKTKEERIVAGAGSDDILDILIRLINPITVITSSPTFGMYSFLGKINGSSFVDVPRDSNFDVIPEKIIEAAKKHLRPIVFLASPNNPTGNLLENSAIEYLATELEKLNSLLVVDEAYAEFARETSIHLVNSHVNLVVVRTFSKWAGLAGLRVGYSISDPILASYMMAIKQPYNINVAADVGARATLSNLEEAMKRVKLIKDEREKLKEEITTLFGKWLQVYPSEANFLLIKVTQIPAYLLCSYLRKKGILVRYFNTSVLQSFIRISAGTQKETKFLIQSLHVLSSSSPNIRDFILQEYKPQAILWDMDGVLADVSKSYRQSIIKTCEHFGVSITTEDIAKAKAAGNANNDWILSLTLITSKWNKNTTIPSLKEVTHVFENLYQGTDQIEGLWKTEQLIPSIELLEYAFNKYPMAIVTGRPRKDALSFLNHFNIAKYFKYLVCMEDAPAKPDPSGVKMALKALNVSTALMIGDTPDDIRAAVGGDIVGIGLISPSESSKSSTSSLIEESMYNAGALFVINSFLQFKNII